MLIACWSPKGGSGTTVIACGIAAVLARTAAQAGVLIADLAGDASAVLGVADAAGPGLAEWLAAGPDVAATALGRVAEVDGNRTRRTGIACPSRFEGGGCHQVT